MSHLQATIPVAESSENRKRKALLMVLQVEKKLLEASFSSAVDPYVKLVVSEKLITLDDQIRANQAILTVEVDAAPSVPVRPAFHASRRKAQTA